MNSRFQTQSFLLFLIKPCHLFIYLLLLCFYKLPPAELLSVSVLICSFLQIMYRKIKERAKSSCLSSFRFHFSFKKMVYFIHWIGYFILLLFTPGNFIELLKLNSVLLLHMKATGERDGVFERIHIHLKKVKLQGHNIPCISTEAFGESL